MKLCLGCGNNLPLSDFHSNGGGTKRPRCRTCESGRDRARYRRRRDAITAQQAEYRARQGSDWAQRNKAWRDANPDYYARNRDRLAAQGRIKAAERRARLRGLPTERIDPLVVLELDDGLCGICGEDVDPNRFQVDHVIPIALGGPHLYSNVQVAHATCNQKKGASWPD